MSETDDYMTDDERQAWLRSARAYGAAFPEFADLVALIEARLLAVGPSGPADKSDNLHQEAQRERDAALE